jgi:hypothetical protein
MGRTGPEAPVLEGVPAQRRLFYGNGGAFQIGGNFCMGRTGLEAPVLEGVPAQRRLFYGGAAHRSGPQPGAT